MIIESADHADILLRDHAAEIGTNHAKLLFRRALLEFNRPNPPKDVLKKANCGCIEYTCECLLEVV